jgi:hypothetical protein
MGYLFTFLKPQHAYYANWQEMRRRRRLFWTYTALMMPVTVLLWLIVSPLCFLLKSDAPAGAVAIAMMIGWPAARIYQLRWPCPRCGKPFFFSWWGYRYYRDQCAHCDLPLYAPCDPAEQQWEFESHV